jgi:hypothetical protein
MRHLGSIALAIVLTPLLYVLAGVGEIKFATNGAKIAAGQGTDWTAIGIGAAAIVIAGGLFALLVMARISPLGPVIAALALIGVTVWAVLKQASLIKLLGHSVFGINGAAEAPLSGLALLLAVPLVITIASPRRWRSKDKVAVATYDTAVPPTEVPPTAAPTYGDGDFEQPTYPVPTSAAPTYVPTPHASAPTQLTPETAADSQTVIETPADEPTHVDEATKDE